MLFCLPFLILACGKAPEVVDASGTPQTTEPEQELYERTKAARYQIGIATDRLAEAVSIVLGMAQEEEAEVKGALDEVASHLAKAGSLIADFDVEPPALDAFKAAFAEQDEARLKAIEGCNDALVELDAAQVVTDDLLASEPPEDAKQTLTAVAESMHEARDALKDAIQEMDGTLLGS